MYGSTPRRLDREVTGQLGPSGLSFGPMEESSLTQAKAVAWRMFLRVMLLAGTDSGNLFRRGKTQ